MHCGGYLGGLRPQVLLKYNTIMVDDKRHDTGSAILRGIGDYRYSTEQMPVYLVILSASLRMLTLAGQYAVEVAVIG